MRVSFADFDPAAFSFHGDPVLVLDNFWSGDERRLFREAMGRSSWRALEDMPQVHAAFPDCGNWRKAAIAMPEVQRLLARLAFPCIERYMESFDGITGRSLSFSYYSYGAGDCLLTHDDLADGPRGGAGALTTAERRLALVSYFHEEWETDWGGELMIYSSHWPGGSDRIKLTLSHCVAPEPGSLVLFTVPQYHRVCRVDPLVGEHKRLSIAGWFLTEHAGTGRYEAAQATARR